MARSASGARWWALGALTLAVLTIGFDITIMNVALPTLSTALATGTDGLQWIVNAYILMFASLMLPIGAVADRYGRKAVLLAGLVVFACASLLAAWADDVTWVVIARAALGVGAAMIMPTTLAAIAVLFDPAERGKALSIVVMGMGAGIPLGPIIGGYLLNHFWWGSIFLVNVPIIVAALAAVAVLLPESRDPEPRRADLVGGLLSIVGLLAFVWGAIEAPDRGWTDPLVLTALLGAVVVLVGFLWWENRVEHPMIDLALFRDRQFSWGNANATLVSFALFGLLFVVPLYLQFVLGHDAFNTGLRLLPLIGGFVVGVGVGTRVANKIGHRIPITVGLALTAVGLGLGATTDIGSGFGHAATWFVIAGLGIGSALTPSMDAVLAVLPPERAGSGTAITMTLRQAGGALGVALLGSLLSGIYIDKVNTTGLPPAAATAAHDSLGGALAVAQRLGLPNLAESANTAYIDGMNIVLITCAAISLLGAVLTFLFMPRSTAQAATAHSPVHL
ncbi:DHA2 family efflux MFS transporter permease subunit [Actinokineospora globicatena]|uniref:DHA2 family efflux MFS transporter permease subunit n=1 Tax=Actinokineospora globicatena TaxID=103729 RepID=UPI0020A36C7A|nr:DHA2 family efflux MFS transporter permease subunit [Actinokineospora globicatena]MCP2303356.1 drug resistance transporter, EmrB/QacA subfamily [Actinokineospora globicatena]